MKLEATYSKNTNGSIKVTIKVVDQGNFPTINIFNPASENPSDEAWKLGEGKESTISETLPSSDKAKQWVLSQVKVLKEKLDHWRNIVVPTDYYGFLIEKGTILFDMQEFKLAIKNFKDVVANTDDKGKLRAAYNNMGLCYASLGKYNAAIECYDKAIGTDPGSVHGWTNKARALAYMGDKTGAKNCFKKAEEIDPSNQIVLKTKHDLSLLS